MICDVFCLNKKEECCDKINKFNYKINYKIELVFFNKFKCSDLKYRGLNVLITDRHETSVDSLTPKWKLL